MLPNCLFKYDIYEKVIMKYAMITDIFALVPCGMKLRQPTVTKQISTMTMLGYNLHKQDISR